MIRKLIANAVRKIALNSGRLSGLYRRLCRPAGQEWALYVKKFGGLHAIGDGCVIQMNVTFTDPAYVRLGNNVHLTGCTIFGHDGSINMLTKATGKVLDRVGPVDIRDNVFVGHQAMVMPGVTIGPMAIVAAGAVVTRDVPPGSIVAGSPAKVIGQVATYLERLETDTEKLPWFDLLKQRTDQLAPADNALNEVRIRHFFGTEHKA